MGWLKKVAAMPGTSGWMLAGEPGSSQGSEMPGPEMILSSGCYVATLNRVDCEGCAAAVEAAVQTVPGVKMTGVVPVASVLVFEVTDGSTVPLSDIRQTLRTVSEGIGRVIQLNGVRGPMPVKQVALK